MVEEGRFSLIPSGSVSPTSVAEQLRSITPEVIAETKRVMRLFQESIPDLLLDQVDIGYIKGISGKVILDSGNQNIINFFNCYTGDRTILHQVDDGKQISIVLEVHAISRANGTVFGTGVGAASTQETRHKYRWEDNPLEWGYSEADMENWPNKDKRIAERTGAIEYKILNPNHSELLDIITRQASKRAEADLVKSLPGAGTAIRMMVDPKLQKLRQQRSRPDWKWFWAEVQKIGLSEEQVHEILGVTSLKDWLDQGRSLEDAVSQLERSGKPASPPSQASPPQKPKQASKMKPGDVLHDQVTNLGQLFYVCQEVYGMAMQDVLRELGVRSQEDIDMTPWECWTYIKGAKGD